MSGVAASENPIIQQHNSPITSSGVIAEIHRLEDAAGFSRVCPFLRCSCLWPFRNAKEVFLRLSNRTTIISTSCYKEWSPWSMPPQKETAAASLQATPASQKSAYTMILFSSSRPPTPVAELQKLRTTQWPPNAGGGNFRHLWTRSGIV